MTVDEIKQSTPMRSMFERYAIPINRNGFARCPFHHERTASCKVYKDSFYCFGCGAHGDVFTFVERMEGCDFRKAFEILGGTDEPRTDAALLRESRRKAKAKMLQKQLSKRQEEYTAMCDRLIANRAILGLLEPMSYTFCAVVDRMAAEDIKADLLLQDMEKLEGELNGY